MQRGDGGRGGARRQTLAVEGARLQLVAFYGVFDGHGGRAAAEFLRENLMKNVIENENFMSDPERALKEAFLRTDEDFYGAAPGETS